ncbi:hypothetical protein L3Q82_017309 [Scortum barcoo]|uniref:Uncharacterized protein n=1 Tax=Scortum barcoo TaxID=214431 RepID=A0ACB8VKK7_9TELE|nr:hypothetical protein L3Q82_017309 [Scortum barcoo]
MASLSHDFSEKLFKAITNAVGTLLLIVLFYILQYIFDLHFVCSCKPGLHLNGVVYMAAPPVILTWVVNVTESFHRKKNVTSWQSLFPNSCGFSWSVVMKYLSLTIVWITAVLFDGDWYFCLKTNFNASETGIPCKTNLTPDEQQIKNNHKTKSLDWGFFLICSVLILWSIVESIRGCCRRGYCKKYLCNMDWCKFCCCLKSCRSMCCPPHYRVVYEDLLAEQVNCYLREELNTIAKKKAEGICKPSVQVISDREQLLQQTLNDNANNTVSEAWWNISASDFYLVELEGGEDSGAVTSAQENSDQGKITGSSEAPHDSDINSSVN